MAITRVSRTQMPTDNKSARFSMFISGIPIELERHLIVVRTLYTRKSCKKRCLIMYKSFRELIAHNDSQEEKKSERGYQFASLIVTETTRRPSFIRSSLKGESDSCDYSSRGSSRLFLSSFIPSRCSHPCKNFNTSPYIKIPRHSFLPAVGRSLTNRKYLRLQLTL